MTILKDVFLNGKVTNIRISGNLISDIRTDIIPNQDETVMDCSHKAILPSFCNTHTHAAMMFLRGVGEDKELFSWLNDDIWPREAKLTSQMIYTLSRFALLEMIKTGTTMFSDMYGFPLETIRATHDMGIRGAISIVGMDFLDSKQIQPQIDKLNDFFKADTSYLKSSRIIKGVSCHAIYTASEEVIRFAKELAKQHHSYFHMHSSETNKEIEECLLKYHCQPIELLNKWGVLDRHTILAHCLHLNDHEIDLLAQTQAMVAHCPASSLKLNSGQMDLQKYLDRGVRVSLGTDGVSSNNSLSMITEMKLAALSAKNKTQNISAAKVNDVYQIATRNGFEFFGVDAGEIKVGKLADFILVDLDNILLMPHHNLVSNMIYAADSSCITDVFCDGVAVMKDRIVPHEEEIKSEFKELLSQLF